MIKKAFVPLGAPHDVGERVMRAWVQGAPEFQLATPGDPIGDVNVVYGILHGMTPVIRECQAEGRDWIYIDHGYVGRSSRYWVPDGKFRVCKNDRHMDSPMRRIEHRKSSEANQADVVAIVRTSPFVKAFDRIDADEEEMMAKYFDNARMVRFINKGDNIAEFDLVAAWDSAMVIRALEEGKRGLMFRPVCPWTCDHSEYMQPETYNHVVGSFLELLSARASSLDDMRAGIPQGRL